MRGLAAALVLLVTAGVGCSGTSDRASGHDRDRTSGHETPPPLDGPPSVRLLAGTQPDGVLLYESWVIDGELRISEPEAIPENLVAVPWRRGQQLTFEVGSGQPPLYADVLLHDQVPADRVPNTDPEHIQCLASNTESRCRVDNLDDSLRMTVRASEPSEIIILNIGWTRPETDRDQDPNLPSQVSASWVFAVEMIP